MLRDTPLLSVVVPVYNVERYLDRCVSSIVNQTYKNLEIILVDDGSTDSSGKLCDEWAAKDKRVQVFHKPNGGLVSARQAGTAISNGEYIAQVDSDDWIEHDMYAELMSLAVEHDADVVLSGMYRDYGTHSVELKDEFTPGVYDREKLQKEVLPFLVDTDSFFHSRINSHITTEVFKRKSYVHHQLRLPPKAVVAEDVGVVYPYIFSSQRIVFSGSSYYHYSIRDGSVMDDGRDMSESNTAIAASFEFSVKQYQNIVPNLKEQMNCVLLYTRLFTEPETVFASSENGLYPFVDVNKGERLIIYGSGKFGRRLKRYLERTHLYDVVAFCDKNHAQGITPLEEALKMNFDKIIISVLKAEVAAEIERMLLQLGVEKSRIVRARLE